MADDAVPSTTTRTAAAAKRTARTTRTTPTRPRAAGTGTSTAGAVETSVRRAEPVRTSSTTRAEGFVADLQGSALNHVRKSQELATALFGQWSEVVGPSSRLLTPAAQLDPSTRPDPRAGLGNAVPTPEAFVSAAFDLAEAVLAWQRACAERFFAVLPR